MTAEEHLRLVIGDLVIRVAQLAAEVDALKAAAATPAPPPRARRAPPPPEDR